MSLELAIKVAHVLRCRLIELGTDIGPVPEDPTFEIRPCSVCDGKKKVSRNGEKPIRCSHCEGSGRTVSCSLLEWNKEAIRKLKEISKNG